MGAETMPQQRVQLVSAIPATDLWEDLTPWRPTTGVTGVRGVLILCEKLNNFRVRIGVQTATSDIEAPDTPVSLSVGTGTGYITTAGSNSAPCLTCRNLANIDFSADRRDCLKTYFGHWKRCGCDKADPWLIAESEDPVCVDLRQRLTCCISLARYKRDGERWICRHGELTNPPAPPCSGPCGHFNCDPAEPFPSHPTCAGAKAGIWGWQAPWENAGCGGDTD